MKRTERLLSKVRPDLALQWHPSKNKTLSLKDITVGSGKRVWWVCNKNHEWDAPVNNRARTNGTGCPFCAGKRAIPGETDLLTRYPFIADQWHPTLNGVLMPSDVLPKSHKRVWWICSKEHIWDAVVSSRVSGTGCPVCSNKKVLAGFNDLSTLHPGIAKDWHPTLNGDLKAEDVVPNSHTVVWWVCDSGHVWDAVVYSRVAGNGCPVCAGRQVLRGYNDLATTHPLVAESWSGVNELQPEDVSHGSEKVATWTCPSGHSWSGYIFNRTRHGCPKCAFKVSSPESELLRLLEPLNPTTQEKLGSWYVDIFIKELNLVIEYDGWYWHKDREEVDIRKTNDLLDSGKLVVRVRERTVGSVLPDLPIKHPSLLQLPWTYSKDGKGLKETTAAILEWVD